MASVRGRSILPMAVGFALGLPALGQAAASGPTLEWRGAIDLSVAMGQTAAAVPTGEVFTVPNTLRVEWTSDTVSLLVYAGAQIQEVHRGSASLEEAFLALVEER